MSIYFSQKRDAAVLALFLELPKLSILSQKVPVFDVDRLYLIRKRLSQVLSSFDKGFGKELLTLYGMTSNVGKQNKKTSVSAYVYNAEVFYNLLCWCHKSK